MLREDKKQRAKLPDEFVTDQVYKLSRDAGNSALSVEISEKGLIGKPELDVNEDDDDRHRRLVERLTKKIRKKPVEERDHSSNANVVKSKDITVAKLDAKSSQEVEIFGKVSDELLDTSPSADNKNDGITTAEEVPKQSLIAMFAKSEKTAIQLHKGIVSVEEIHGSVAPVQEDAVEEKIIREATTSQISVLANITKSQSPQLKSTAFKRRGTSNMDGGNTKTIQDNITNPSTTATVTQVVSKWTQLAQILAFCVTLCFIAAIFYIIVFF